MERDSDDEDEEDAEEKDEDDEDEDEEEDENEDEGNEPRIIAQGEMVNTSADDVDNRVDDHTIMLPEQGQETCEYIPWPPPPESSTHPKTVEPHP